MAGQESGSELQAKQSAFGYLRAWGGKEASYIDMQSLLNSHSESPGPPTITATLVAAQHLRPPQFLPLLFPPLMLFSSYMNLSDYKIDAAGTNAAWSGLYLLLARRRKRQFMQKWGTRGILRGATMGLCAVNLVAGGFVYVTRKRKDEPEDN